MIQENYIGIYPAYAKIAGRMCTWCGGAIEKGSRTIRGMKIMPNGYRWRPWWHLSPRNCFGESQIAWLEEHPYDLKPRGRKPAMDLTRDQWILRTKLTTKVYLLNKEKASIASTLPLNLEALADLNGQIRKLAEQYLTCGGLPPRLKKTYPQLTI